jgi:hypothetical protein
MITKIEAIRKSDPGKCNPIEELDQDRRVNMNRLRMKRGIIVE